ncbi:unnamed protein product [Cochlearia groenlandica]
MASPSDRNDSRRDPVSETRSPETSFLELPVVEEQEEPLHLEISNLVADKALNRESTQDPEASIDETSNEIDDDNDAAQAAISPSHRRGGGPKRKKGILKRLKHEEKSKEKLDSLLKTLKPIAFVPGKALDLSGHEKLLKTLGLWDFLHLDFDRNIRRDLVANLVAYYNPESRCSYVNGARINISRADLARALKLPKKKDIVITEDEDKEVLEEDESIRFVEEVLLNWVLLHREEDDMCIVPEEIVEFQKDIKEKHLDKLDWAALLWFMVERELKAELPLSDCFFASHLQMLIRTQKEDLLRERPKVNDDDDDDDVKEVDFSVRSPIEAKSPIEDVGAGDLQRDDVATFSKDDKHVEEHMIELNLGQETASRMVSEEGKGLVEGEPMDVEENKKEGDVKWVWNNEDSHAGSHFLRRCDLSNNREGDEENKTEGLMVIGEDEEPIEQETEEDNEKHEGGFPFFPNGGDSLHGVSQENLMLGDASLLGYASGLQIHDNSVMHMTMGSGSSSLFANGNNKREVDHENDISYHSNKRLRTEEPSWDDKPPTVELCLEQIEYWVHKSKLSCAEKDEERGESVMNQQYLMSELHNKEEMIRDMERSKFEELRKKDLMIYRLENELGMMMSVLEGYRKTLREMKKASREHRRRCPLRNGDDKPVYKDVKGSGGLVLSINEIEKMRLKQLEEDKMTRGMIERKINEFGSGWLKVFKEHIERVELLEERLVKVENQARETVFKSKSHEACEVASAVEET